MDDAVPQLRYRAPILFWLALATMIAYDGLWLPSILKGTEPPPSAEVLMGVGLVLIGRFLVLNPERIQRLASKGDRRVLPFVVSILGWVFTAAGAAIAVISGILLVVRMLTSVA